MSCCSICVSDIIDPIITCFPKNAAPPDTLAVTLECNHSFHTKCIQPWLARHNTCPNCRSLSGSSTPHFAAPLAAVTHASGAVRGSRESNEDCAGSVLLDAYAFSVVCDGHSGVLVATILGTSFIETLRQQLEGISGTAPVEQLIQVLQAAYTIALGEVDKRASTVGLGRASCGSTITAVVLQRASMICATAVVPQLQLWCCSERA